MGEENRVILHGMWASPYAKRVELGLKLKGIPFEYVEEDLENKSELLLKYNPVHKKVPVLVHSGKPISESLVILEYIDETWKNGPRFLPNDPYERAQVRFWAAYIQQVYESMAKLFTMDKEAQEKALEEVYQKLRLLEDGIVKDLYPDGAKINDHVHEQNLGLLDIMITVTLGAYKAQEEGFGVKILDSERNPILFSWVEELIKLPAVKEISPPHEKSVAVIRFIREKRGISLSSN